MSQSETREIVWLLTLIPLGVVVGVGLFFVHCAWRRATNKDEDSSGEFSIPMQSSSSLEQPARWLAVKAVNPSVIQAALRLHRPTLCSWEQGMAEAHDDKLFISPSVSGWVLVVGPGLPDPAEDSDHCYHFLTALSRKVGQVQFFSVSRVVNYHSWAMLDRGQVCRAYSWAGETLWNQGPMSAAEKELDMLCLEYASEQNPFVMREALSANCEKVNLLSARWSVDPAAISPDMWRGLGIVGALH